MNKSVVFLMGVALALAVVLGSGYHLSKAKSITGAQVGGSSIGLRHKNVTMQCSWETTGYSKNQATAYCYPDPNTFVMGGGCYASSPATYVSESWYVVGQNGNQGWRCAFAVEQNGTINTILPWGKAGARCCKIVN